MSRSFYEEIITSSNEMFKEYESDMAVGNRQLGNSTGETARSQVTVQQTAGSSILTQKLHAQKSDL